MDVPSANQLSDSYPTWHFQPPHISSTSTPRLLSRTALEHDPDLPDNFPRTAKWCGDGSSLIVQCENRSFQMFATHDDSKDLLSIPSSLVHAKTFPQSAPVVDFVWYPGASQHNPPAFCFVASVRDCPVKLLDGKDGRLRASYPIVDHRERHIAPHSLAFNLTADKYVVVSSLFSTASVKAVAPRVSNNVIQPARLYCGFEDAIEIFDVQRPGEGERLATTPSKKSKDGLKGIISALAFSYFPEYYAAGSLTPASHASDNIALFNESALEPILSIGGVAEQERGGVTQLMFNPSRPHILYAAFRRSETLWSWDLRGDPSTPLCSFSKVTALEESYRNHLTNQRRWFDVEGTGKWLASGNQRGEVVIYDLTIDGGESLTSDGNAGGVTRQWPPTLAYDAHGGLSADTVGAVMFHPLEPLLLSVSGSRHFGDVDPTASSQHDSESDSESSEGSAEDGVVSKLRDHPRPSVHDATIKMWDFSSSRGREDDLG